MNNLIIAGLLFIFCVVYLVSREYIRMTNHIHPQKAWRTSMKINKFSGSYAGVEEFKCVVCGKIFHRYAKGKARHRGLIIRKANTTTHSKECARKNRRNFYKYNDKSK